MKLTLCEQITLVELVKGYRSQQQMADHLCISRDGLRYRLYGMYRKTGTKNATQLMLWAIGQAMIVSAACQLMKYTPREEQP